MFDVVCENDSLGNCKVLDAYGNEITSTTHIGNINPFRWKSFYFDAETGLYYANGSYYDPETGLYLNAAPMESIADKAFVPKGIDRSSRIIYNQQYTRSLVSSPLTENDVTLPSIPSWVEFIPSTICLSLEISIAMRTTLYLLKYPEVYNLMRMDGINIYPGRINSVSKVFGIVTVFLDTGLDIYYNVYQERSAGVIIGSAAYTLATDMGILWISTRIAAFFGNAAFGPAGLIIGSFLGIIAGLFLSALSYFVKKVIFNEKQKT